MARLPCYLTATPATHRHLEEIRSRPSAELNAGTFASAACDPSAFILGLRARCRSFRAPVGERPCIWGVVDDRFSSDQMRRFGLLSRTKHRSLGRSCEPMLDTVDGVGLVGTAADGSEAVDQVEPLGLWRPTGRPWYRF